MPWLRRLWIIWPTSYSEYTIYSPSVDSTSRSSFDSIWWNEVSGSGIMNYLCWMSPMALLTARLPSTLATLSRMVTKPLLRTILLYSSVLPGVWSTVNFCTSPLFLSSIAEESPMLATVSYKFCIIANAMVEPALSLNRRAISRNSSSSCLHTII